MNLPFHSVDRRHAACDVDRSARSDQTTRGPAGSPRTHPGSLNNNNINNNNTKNNINTNNNKWKIKARPFYFDLTSDFIWQRILATNFGDKFRRQILMTNFDDEFW
jgi:hypothetical protein